MNQETLTLIVIETETTQQSITYLDKAVIHFQKKKIWVPGTRIFETMSPITKTMNPKIVVHTEKKIQSNTLIDVPYLQSLILINTWSVNIAWQCVAIL